MHELRGKGNPAHWDTIALKAHCTLKCMRVFYHNIKILEMGLVGLAIKKNPQVRCWRATQEKCSSQMQIFSHQFV